MNVINEMNRMNVWIEMNRKQERKHVNNDRVKERRKVQRGPKMESLCIILVQYDTKHTVSSSPCQFPL